MHFENHVNVVTFKKNNAFIFLLSEEFQPTLTKHSMLTSLKQCIIDIFAAISLNGIGLFCVRVHVRETASGRQALCGETE